MLILSRKTGETLMIGDKVKITVMDVVGGQVKIGIDAPKDIKISREEIFLQNVKEELLSPAPIQ